MDADSYKLIRLVTHSNLRAEEKEGKIDMCLAIEEIRRESYQLGFQLGWKIGIQLGEIKANTRCIRSLMRNLCVSADQAMDLLDIPKEERKRYAMMAKDSCG